MHLSLAKLSPAAAAAALLLVATASTPAIAKDWRQSMDRHYAAEEEARFVPKGDNPQWDFNLETVVSDMEWRRRTARMLHSLPRPGDDATVRESGQLADRPEPPALRFAF